jgi:SAM-dependent methyltransferase
MTPENTVWLRDAIAYYQRRRPYFYVFLRPYELLLFHREQARFTPPLLDFGCGDGFFARFLFQPGQVNYGVDRDPAVAPAAQTVYRQVVLCEEDRIPLPADSIGAIFSNSVFEHLTAPDAALRELHRLLQPGGRLYASVIVKQWERDLWGANVFGAWYARYMRRVQRHHALLEPDEWSARFARAGFQIEQRRGYLNAACVRLVDRYHYLSLPSLLGRALWRRWDHPLARRYNRMLARLRAPVLSSFPEAGDASPCFFFELYKSKEL